MSDTISHRGPDDDGFHCGRGIGLGHRRLSIIDLEGGHQPLANEDETIWVVFNGEIYNFEEAKPALSSDEPPIPALAPIPKPLFISMRNWGEACFAQMRGMFAIALWDGRRKKPFHAKLETGSGKNLFFIPGTASASCSRPR